MEDCTGFRERFRIDIADFEYTLTQISLKHRHSGTDAIKCDERLAVN